MLAGGSAGTPRRREGSLSGGSSMRLPRTYSAALPSAAALTAPQALSAQGRQAMRRIHMLGGLDAAGVQQLSAHAAASTVDSHTLGSGATRTMSMRQLLADSAAPQLPAPLPAPLVHESVRKSVWTGSATVSGTFLMLHVHTVAAAQLPGHSPLPEAGGGAGAEAEAAAQGAPPDTPAPAVLLVDAFDPMRGRRYHFSTPSHLVPGLADLLRGGRGTQVAALLLPQLCLRRAKRGMSVVLDLRSGRPSRANAAGTAAPPAAAMSAAAAPEEAAGGDAFQRTQQLVARITCTAAAPAAVAAAAATSAGAPPGQVSAWRLAEAITDALPPSTFLTELSADDASLLQEGGGLTQEQALRVAAAVTGQPALPPPSPAPPTGAGVKAATVANAPPALPGAQRADFPKLQRMRAIFAKRAEEGRTQLQCAKGRCAAIKRCAALRRAAPALPA